MAEPVSEVEPPRPWWDTDRRQIENRVPDESVPGGLILHPRSDQLHVPDSSPAFSVVIGPGSRRVVALDGSAVEIGVVVTGHQARLALVAGSENLSGVTVGLTVIGRSSNDSAASLVVSTTGVALERLHVEAAAQVQTEVAVPDVVLHAAGYVCRGHNDAPMVRLTASAACTVDLDTQFDVVAGQGTRLTMLGESNVPRLDVADDVVITLEPGEAPATSPVLQIGTNVGYPTVAAGRAVVRIAERVDSLRVHGGRVEILGDASATGLILEGSGGMSTLALHPRASAEDVRGVARLGECRHARVKGAPDDPLVIDSVAPDQRQPDREQWKDAIITGIRVPPGLRGVPVLLAAIPFS